MGGQAGDWSPDRRPEPLAALAAGTTRQPRVREGTEGSASSPGSSPAHLCQRPAGSALSHTCGREGPRILCPAEGRSPPLLWGPRSSPPPGIASDQVLQVHLGDRLSPVAEGAELWAWEGGILFLVEKREHMFHELAQPVVPGSGEDTYCDSALDLRA